MSDGRHATRYRGQFIHRNDNVNPGRMGRYLWNGRQFSLMAHARAAIDDHFKRLEP